jgi:hypothetical protein
LGADGRLDDVSLAVRAEGKAWLRALAHGPKLERLEDGDEGCADRWNALWRNLSVVKPDLALEVGGLTDGDYAPGDERP